MKRILLSLGLLLTTVTAMAQVPQGIKNQAVMRGSDGIQSKQSNLLVKIDNGGLHCPFLGPRFIRILSDCSEVDSLSVNTTTGVAELYLNQYIPIDTVRKLIINDIGYPELEIISIEY